MADPTPYPHRQLAEAIPLCACGAEPDNGPASTWGADCPVAMRAEIDRLRGVLRSLDCRYPGGAVADLTGSHCPLGAPCERCQRDARIEELERQIDAATAIVHTTTGSRDDR